MTTDVCDTCSRTTAAIVLDVPRTVPNQETPAQEDPLRMLPTNRENRHRQTAPPKIIVNEFNTFNLQ